MNKAKRVTLPGIGAIYCQSRSYARFAHSEIFHKGEYLQHGIELAPGAVIIDVGANIGLFSLFAHGRCRSDATIFAFEPIRETFSLLQKNAELHGLTKQGKVRLFNLGLTGRDSPRRATFSYYRNSSGLSTMRRAELEQILGGSNPDNVINALRASNPPLYFLSLPLYPIRRWLVQCARQLVLRHQEVPCELTTLSDVLHRYPLPRINLLKIDVEGSELDVLTGIDDEHWPLIEQLVIEVHDIDGRLEAITRLLEKRGFGVVETELQPWSRGAAVATFMVYAR